MENERDEKQVVRIIHDEDDLDMLFAISQADGKAICGLWYLNIVSRTKLFKSQIMEMKSRE